ncbi:MAG: hypothetical protein LCH36_07060 [Actinobacteria bacterium]|nr:hypothetical protein [Actinomycetota bacterium]
MDIQNQNAAQQATALARDYLSAALDMIAGLPVTQSLSTRLLEQLNVHVRAARPESTIMPQYTETLEIACRDSDVPDSATQHAVGVLTRVETRMLGTGLEQQEITARQGTARAELTRRRQHLNKPIGIVARVSGGRGKRRNELAALLADTLMLLENVAAGTVNFNTLFDQVLTTAGFTPTQDGYVLTDERMSASIGSFTAGDLGDARFAPDRIRAQVSENNRVFYARWITILAWAYDAVTDDANESIGAVLTPMDKLAHAMNAKRAAQRKAEQDREAAKRQAEQDRRQQIIAERAQAEQIRIEQARLSAAIDRVQFAEVLSPWGENDAPQMSENREETEEPTL